MPLSPGTRLGSYEIIAALGSGGMGEVYRAHDRKLNRAVAIKVLPAVFASDPDQAFVRPTWSPDGRRLSVGGGLGRGAAVIDLDRPLEGRVEFLEGIPDPAFVGHSWSPDGRFVAGVQEMGGTSSSVFLYEFDGTFRKIHESSAPVYGGTMVWLADSRRLLFASSDAGVTLLDTIAGTTREVLPRPRGQAEITALAKAAKADVLAFVERRTAGDLWIMRRK